MYFNKRYKRNGPLFQGKFRASRITKDAYLQHISRYIHSNPAHPLEYRWSSLPYYMGRLNATWVKPGRVMAMFSGKDDYLQFMQNYREQQEILQMLKYELADV